VGGGVIANKDLRFKIQELGHEFGWRVHFPANMMLCTDNAAMIGVVAGYKYERGEFAAEKDLDRRPKWKVGQS
jgi:N6-L-threonylcarbamoyladenine synthase